MTFVDSQHKGRPVARCLSEAGPAPGAYSPSRSETSAGHNCPARTAV